MKLWSKESLMVGGIYSVLSTPFFMYKTTITEQINIFLFSIFIICMFLLYWSKFALLVTKQTIKFSKLSYYIISFGWIPYFVLIGSILIFIFAGIFSLNDKTLEIVINIFNSISIWGLPILRQIIARFESVSLKSWNKYFYSLL